MKSAHPSAGDPWPHDMVVSIEDRPHSAWEMLWVREAYGLAPSGDLPPPLIDPPAPATRSLGRTERARWEAAWSSLWTPVIEHAGRPTDAPAMDRLLRQDLSADERATLLAEVTGPSWSDEFGHEVFHDPSYRDAEERSLEAWRTTRPRRLDDLPERRDVVALAPAWRRGLIRVVVIPCRGSYVRTLGPAGLLVTTEVRDDSATYREALSSFAPR